MSLFYITGISGVGKSTVKDELLRKGYKAYESDAFAEFYNKKTEKVAEKPKKLGDRTKDWYELHEWKIPRAKIESLENKSENDLVFLCGVTANEKDYWDLFSKVFCLTTDKNTLSARIKNRKNNDFGKSPEEFEMIMGWHKTNNKYYAKLGAVIIDNSRPISKVVEEILSYTPPGGVVT